MSFTIYTDNIFSSNKTLILSLNAFNYSFICAVWMNENEQKLLFPLNYETPTCRFLN